MEDDIIAYLDYCVCRAEFENDEVIWGEDFPFDESPQEVQTRKRILMEEFEDFNIPY